MTVSGPSLFRDSVQILLYTAGGHIGPSAFCSPSALTSSRPQPPPRLSRLCCSTSAVPPLLLHLSCPASAASSDVPPQPCGPAPVLLPRLCFSIRRSAPALLPPPLPLQPLPSSIDCPICPVFEDMWSIFPLPVRHVSGIYGHVAQNVREVREVGKSWKVRKRGKDIESWADYCIFVNT